MTGGTRGLSPAEPGFTASPCGVVGASARAAVHSLARAGISAWAVDLFCDRDLKRVAECALCPMERYPDALPELASRFPPGPVLYTGGLENYPHVVRELAAAREPWGNPPEVLARVRDPFRVQRILARAGFPTARIVQQGEPCPTEWRWLRKPLRSGGGLGIRFAHPGESASPPHCFQEFIDGPPMSALFVNDAIVGVTDQLIGEPWLHAKPFAYCGNVGPVKADAPVRDVGTLLCENTGLRGVWGVDFIMRDGVPCVLEVNPRYTAAAEVLEHAIRQGVFSIDPLPFLKKEGGESAAYPGGRVAFSGVATGGAAAAPPGPPLNSHLHEGVGIVDTVVGKAIYYAPHAIRFPQSGPWDADLAGDFDPWQLPGFADIPAPGGMIEPGSPVLTFFATGSAPAEVRERLQSRAAELDSLFRDSRP